MAITSSTIDLKWCAASDNNCIDKYKIYDANGDVFIAEVPGNVYHYTVTGLSPSTQYTFYAIAVDCAGNESSHSNNIVASTTAGAPIQRPSDITNLAYFNVTQTTVNLSWDVPTYPLGVGGTNIYYDDGVTLFHQVAGINAFYDPTNLTPSTTYTLKAKAYSDLGVESANFSNTISFTTSAVVSSAPSTPANLIIVATHATSVDLSWDASTFPNGVGGYTVHDQNGTLINTIYSSQTTWTVTGLAGSTSYSFKVKAFGADALVSGFSNIATTTTTAIVATTLNFPSNGAYIAGANANWIAPFAITDTISVASATVPGGSQTDVLYGNGYGFAIPGGATITGVEMHIYRQSQIGYINGSIITLMSATTPIGTVKYSSSNFSTQGEEIIYGFDGDLWGATLTPTIVNDANFGVSISCTNNYPTSDTVEIDWMKLKVYYTT